MELKSKIYNARLTIWAENLFDNHYALLWWHRLVTFVAYIACLSQYGYSVLFEERAMVRWLGEDLARALHVCVEQARPTDRAHNARCLSARARGCGAGRGRRGSWPGPVSELPALAAAARDRECISARTLQTLTLRPSIRGNETSISGKVLFSKRIGSACFPDFFRIFRSEIEMKVI